MTPFFFGDQSARLFGAFHEARRPAPAAPGVLLCAPFGEEAIRIHRTFRILADRLADQGSPVLRFDYGGAGDSWGDGADTSLSTMAADIDVAHRELVDRVGERRIVWIGLRLGASAALRAAATARPRGLVGLLLWEPVADGADYLRTLATAHIRQLAHALDQPAQTIARRLPASAAEVPEEALGFPVCDAMRAELGAFNLSDFACGRVARTIMVLASEKEAGPRERILNALAGFARHVGWTDVAEPASWNSDEAMNEFVTPAASVDAVCRTIGEWR